MRVKEFSKHLGITSDTVRYYTRIGFLKPRKSINNGYHEFAREDLERMVFILRARQLGLTVGDIAQIFDEVENGETPCPLVRELLDKRLRKIEKEMEDSVRLRERMKSAVTKWENKPDQPASSERICSLIEELDLLDTEIQKK